MISGCRDDLAGHRLERAPACASQARGLHATPWLCATEGEPPGCRNAGVGQQKWKWLPAKTKSLPAEIEFYDNLSIEKGFQWISWIWAWPKMWELAWFSHIVRKDHGNLKMRKMMTHPCVQKDDGWQLNRKPRLVEKLFAAWYQFSSNDRNDLDLMMDSCPFVSEFPKSVMPQGRVCSMLALPGYWSKVETERSAEQAQCDPAAGP